MGPETRVRAQRERPLPDVDAEEELELGRYWNALITRWWLPLAGLVAWIAIGYLLSLGGHQVYQAKATIYLGQPLNPTGTGQIQSLATNPSTVKQVVLSPYWQHVAEQRAGLDSGRSRRRRCIGPGRPEPPRQHRRHRQEAREDCPRRRRARQHLRPPGFRRLRRQEDPDAETSDRR